MIKLEVRRLHIKVRGRALSPFRPSEQEGGRNGHSKPAYLIKAYRHRLIQTQLFLNQFIGSIFWKLVTIFLEKSEKLKSIWELEFPKLNTLRVCLRWKTFKFHQKFNYNNFKSHFPLKILYIYPSYASRTQIDNLSKWVTCFAFAHLIKEQMWSEADIIYRGGDDNRDISCIFPHFLKNVLEVECRISEGRIDFFPHFVQKMSNFFFLYRPNRLILL